MTQRTVRPRLSTVGSPGLRTYTYDGDGRRVTKIVNGGPATTYVYDAQGSLIAEYGGLNPVLGTSYLYVDHLGSTRLLTDGGGNQQSCNDYLPFGGDILSLTDGRGACFPSAAPSGGIKFTGQERDAESGLDFFGARYFSWAQGRLTSPDEPFNNQDASNPQTWNLFSYARNNPLSFIDPTGNCSVKAGASAATDDPNEPCVKPGDSSVTVSAEEKPDVALDSPLFFAVVRGVQGAAPVADPRFILQFYGASIVGGAVGVGVGALAGGTGLTTLGIGATRAATLAPLILPAGQKLAQIIARLGQGQQNPQLVLQKLTELRDASVAAGTAVQGFYIQSGATIYRVGQDFLTVSGQGKILSYVQNATSATGVAQRYIELGGK